MRLIGAVVAILAVGLALVGCAKPSGPATREASASGTPSPTPTQAAIPPSGLPLDCSALDVAASVAAHYRADTVGVSVDENSTARGFAFRAFQQGGGLRCVWGGSGRTDGGYDVGIEFFVLTDASSDYATYSAKAGPAVDWVAGRYGDHSRSFCTVYQDNVQCYGDVLIGTSWLDYRLTDYNHTMTLDQAYTWGDEQVRPAVAAISGAGAPRPAWVPPSTAFDTSKLCDAATASAIAGGTVSIATIAPDLSGYPPGAGMNRAATARCTWTSATADANVRIYGLTGGAWALPGMSANLAETPGILGGAAQPVTIAGADGAFVADGETAWGAVISHGSLVEVQMDSSNTGSDDVPLMTRIAAYIDAHS